MPSLAAQRGALLSRGQAGDSRRRVVTGVGYLRAGEPPPPSWMLSKKGGGPFFRFSFWMHGAPDGGMRFMSRNNDQPRGFMSRKQ